MNNEQTAKFEKDLKLEIRQVSFTGDVLKVEKKVYQKALALVPHLARHSQTMPTFELKSVPAGGEADVLKIRYGTDKIAEIEIRPNRNYLRFENPPFLMAFTSEIQPEIWRRINR